MWMTAIANTGSFSDTYMEFVDKRINVEVNANPNINYDTSSKLKISVQ